MMEGVVNYPPEKDNTTEIKQHYTFTTPIILRLSESNHTPSIEQLVSGRLVGTLWHIVK